jgi:hypothetical protein
MHGGEMGMGNAFGTGSYGMGWCLPRLDEALSALLVDLEERGLLERTLVVVAGEFGRTPRINASGANPGRQHWPACYSAIVAGGGIRGGMVYGESDKIAAYVKDKPVRPQDLGATIYHALGVPLDRKRWIHPSHQFGRADPRPVRIGIAVSGTSPKAATASIGIARPAECCAKCRQSPGTKSRRFVRFRVNFGQLVRSAVNTRLRSYHRRGHAAHR